MVRKKLIFLGALFLMGLPLLLSSCRQTVRTDAPMERFSFSHSGMSTGHIYMLTAEQREDGWFADFDLFCSQTFTLPIMQEDAETLRRLIDTYDLWAWSGYEKTNHKVHDGEGFSLDIHLSDGQVISASGYQSFPRGYTEAKSAILAFFIEIMERHGMKNLF